MKIRTQKREGNKVLIEAEEDYASFEKAVEKALSEAGKEVKLPGFRPGKAPKEMVERALNREAVEQHAAQNLILEIYPKILDEAKLEPVDYPKVEILQQEKGRPFVFKLTVEVYPEVKLGRYKGLKVEKKPEETEADVKNKLIAAASAEAKVDVPAGLVEHEIDIMLDELKTSLVQNNLTLEDYLRGAKKEEKALRDEMRKSAEIRSRGKVVLKAVAQVEKMKVSSEEVQSELKVLGLEKEMGESGKKHLEDYLLRKKALDFLVEKAKVEPA